MNDSVLDRYISTRQSDPKVAASNEQEALDDLGAFGFLRGTRDRAIMLELRFRDGRVLALGYSWMDQAEFDPSEGITLHFPGKAVKIVGTCLNAEVRPNVRLFDGIVRHRVLWIREMDEMARMEATPKAPFIEQIEVK